MSRPVVSTLPTSTTNMTGFFIMSCGVELAQRIDDGAADDAPSKRERVSFGLAGGGHRFLQFLERVTSVQQQVLQDGAERERGEEGQRADDEDDADTSRMVNSGVVTGKVPAVSGAIFLPARLPAMASIGIDHEEAADEHADA